MIHFLEMDIISNFAVFEGGDGAGTTTQLKILTERLKAYSNIRFLPTFEPTDGKIGRIIRQALKKEIIIKPQTLSMLFAADRNEHLNGPEGILEHLAKGYLVVSDRYVLSSLVYQGIECGDELPAALNSGYGIPELTLFFDIDPQISLNRMKGRSSREIYDYREFQDKVREKYKSILEKYRHSGARVEIIDASKTTREVADQVWSKFPEMPIFKHCEINN